MYKVKATQKQLDTLNKLENAAACLGFYRFEDKSYHAKVDAQRNLQGRTHYVDDGTLSFFGGKINGAHNHGGLRYVLLESARDLEGKRKYNVVTFDVFGELLEKNEFSISQAARSYYNCYDDNPHLQPAAIIKQTKEAIKARFKRMDSEKRNARKALKGV